MSASDPARTQTLDTLNRLARKTTADIFGVIPT